MFTRAVGGCTPSFDIWINQYQAEYNQSQNEKGWEEHKEEQQGAEEDRHLRTVEGFSEHDVESR